MIYRVEFRKHEKKVLRAMLVQSDWFLKAQTLNTLANPSMLVIFF